jgi:hypothetical protein
MLHSSSYEEKLKALEESKSNHANELLNLQQQLDETSSLNTRLQIELQQLRDHSKTIEEELRAERIQRYYCLNVCSVCRYLTDSRFETCAITRLHIFNGKILFVIGFLNHSERSQQFQSDNNANIARIEEELKAAKSQIDDLNRKLLDKSIGLDSEKRQQGVDAAVTGRSSISTLFNQVRRNDFFAYSFDIPSLLLCSACIAKIFPAALISLLQRYLLNRRHHRKLILRLCSRQSWIQLKTSAKKSRSVTLILQLINSICFFLA